MYSYPAVKELGTLTPQTGGYGQGCPDAVTGNIYFTTNISGQLVLLQFPYGATSANATISPPQGYEVSACSADSTTGNLAVTVNKAGSAADGYVAIYPPGSSQPQIYNDPDLLAYGACTYDNQGNLFFLSEIKPEQEVLAEFTATSQSFKSFSLTLNAWVTSLQWDGKYVTAETRGRRHNNPPNEIYRLAVADSGVSVVGTTKLKGAKGGIWIQGAIALSGRFGNAKTERYMGYYKYPKGGKPYDVFKSLADDYIHTFAVLPAPSGFHGRLTNDLITKRK